MKYNNIQKAVFLNRPNRFIADIEVDGNKEICHVKNTGRCKELLTDRAEIYVQKTDNPNRKTNYDLIAVRKGDKIINVDSQAPNKAVEEWLNEGGLFKDILYVKREKMYGKSRFDFYAESGNKKCFIEVKGVTLEQDGVVRFPDAPTQRGVKHIYELIECLKNDYSAYVIFVIQMEGVKWFEPNWETHREFGEALKMAKERGVNVMALDCKVTKDSMSIRDMVEVRI